MVDMLPFPNVTAKRPEEQVAELTGYLIQFKETLEFILTNISKENLSVDLLRTLESLGADVAKSNEERTDAMAQMASKALTVPDVINSAAFRAALDREYRFSVNFETGNLEYTKEM